MSEVYIQEPATKGSAVLRTTHGDLEIELWATECPKACRNFCQLILEGYYNGTIFHRIIKDFIVQGGDKTGTGDGSESIYGKPYDDEIHPRLKFRYRGMMGVASAGAGSKTNGSQFFIVLQRSPTLDRKHTLFGKVVGQTIYNLVRLTEVEVDKHDVPVDPPRIIRAELTWDPFGDLEPRFTPAPPIAPRRSEKHRREAIKNKRVLSFGADEEDDSDDEAASSSFGKARSAHDVLRDPKLLKEAAYPGSSASSSAKGSSAKEEVPKKRAAPKADTPAESSSSAKTPSQKPAATTAPPAKAARRKAAASDSESASAKGSGEEKEKASSGDEDSSSDEGGGTIAEKSSKRNAEIARLKRDIANARKGDDAAPVKGKKKSAWEELLAGFKTRGQAKTEKPSNKKARQEQARGVVSGMKDFEGRVRETDKEKAAVEEIDPEVKARKEQAQEDSLAAIWEEGEDESTGDWLTGGGLQFHVGDEREARKKIGKSKENFQIFDPLAAAGDAEMLERARLRRSAQLKPSLRRTGAEAAQFMASDEGKCTGFGGW